MNMYVTDYKKMLLTAESAGIKIVSDDKCCRLLAWLYVHGGGNEAVTVNLKLNADILEAQKRLNLYGGERVNVELLPTLQEYIRQAESSNPDWIAELCKYYGLNLNMSKV
jgi:tRNA(Ile2) C34 agmatinyltransferase TiaS